MLTLPEIRDWIVTLGIAEDENVYIGKLDNKKQKSVGVYGRASSGPPHTALGGLEHTTYDTRPISLLVHWTKSKGESEKAAYGLFNKLREITRPTIRKTPNRYLCMMVS